MKSDQIKFHKSFQLNGYSFTSVAEILAYTKGFSDEIHQFLESWFSSDKCISVQTSGSTGTPKSILLKKEFVVNSAVATGLYFDLQENTTALLCLPTVYIAGKLMLIRAITLGWHLDVVAPNSYPLEKVDKMYDFSAMVPLQLENSISKLSKIKTLIVGGGVVSKELKTKIQDVSTVIFATYGMTETITHIAVKKLNNFSSSKRIITKQSFYKTLPNVTIYIDDRNCLVINAPKVSDEIIFTNDVVQLISDTQFEWLGRFDTVINSGGIKLHPEKIEEKLSEIITRRFFVAGIPDQKLGEKLVLIIEADNYNNFDFQLFIKKEILNLKSISKFETPKEIYFVTHFIETGTKKIQRNKTLDLLKL
ncbi:AMP-binding protein [Polaribacter glomeratus]|uniref:O-succinylbenzoic acid--CoA ligase n=1 Tax=Polaribacter glomeratus TaxID=102 RepID=A0A2S7WWQ6_9FLAO|nr:AMP-binding protein [Polaribacter glomeratus]PQJ82034.1 O-succinylbenzoic acid--CoA ligase [Polaribacter glomeratus]TXD66627.1 AMP-binding protein [Polaribacter glomeratus]